jgi:hypothetical protein
MAEKKPKGSRRRSTLEKFLDHVRAIGMISIENGNLEDVMGALFSRVIMVSLRVGIAIYSTPRVAIGKIEILEKAAKAAYRLHGTDEQRRRLMLAQKRVLNICSRATKLVGKRHRIIHDGWGVDEEAGVVQRYTSGKFIPENVSLSTLQTIIEDYRRLIDDAFALADELKAHPPQMVSMRLE